MFEINMKYGLVFISLLLLSCGYDEKGCDMANTYWSFEFENCQDYFEFSDSVNFISYSCETSDTTFGTYKCTGETISFHQTHGAFDDDLPQGSRHRAGEANFKMVINNGSELGFIEEWDAKKKQWLGDYHFKRSEK